MCAEQEGAALYQMLAKTERDPHLAELYRRMAEAEQRHAAVWKDYLHSASEPVPTYAPGWRVCTLAWLAQRLVVNAVLPMISPRRNGKQAERIIANQKHKPLVWRRMSVHMRTSFAPCRNTGGNALRAAVLGDG